jgi:hypothetical protein
LPPLFPSSPESSTSRPFIGLVLSKRKSRERLRRALNLSCPKKRRILHLRETWKTLVRFRRNKKKERKRR